MSARKWEHYFREEQTPDIMSRVEQVWGSVAGFPVPLGPMTCWCGSDDLQIRSYTFWSHDKRAGTRYRCDVGMKCRRCSGVRDFGTVITQEQFEARAQGQVAFSYEWRTAYQLMQEGA